MYNVGKVNTLLTKSAIGGETMNTKKLKGLMAENNITQQDLAKILRISVTGLNKKLNGKSEFKASEIKIIADFFNVPINIFFVEHVNETLTESV